jgi:hypothetical protein
MMTFSPFRLDIDLAGILAEDLQLVFDREKKLRNTILDKVMNIPVCDHLTVGSNVHRCKLIGVAVAN